MISNSAILNHRDYFSEQICAWYKDFGRHALPWRIEPDPYKVWISEIMLQQTQVKTVIPYFQKFISQIPNAKALAHTDIDQVLHLWSGLGYYTRARNLHRSAQIIDQKYQATLPGDIKSLLTLPGIGRSTAGAILALSFNQSHAILDGNVKRILARYHGIKTIITEPKTEQNLWKLSESHLPSAQQISTYTQAIMDFGAVMCTHQTPSCAKCPISIECVAFNTNQQHILPHIKKKKPIPKRHTAFALIQKESGHYLLEKRINPGVWRGLWCFPECTHHQKITAELFQRYRIKTKEIRVHPNLKHKFTHFELNIKPIHLEVTEHPDTPLDKETLIWYHPNDDSRFGTPAPVSSIFKNLITQGDHP